MYHCTFGVSEPKVPDAESLVSNEQLTEEDVQKDVGSSSCNCDCIIASSTLFYQSYLPVILYHFHFYKKGHLILLFLIEWFVFIYILKIKVEMK